MKTLFQNEIIGMASNNTFWNEEAAGQLRSGHFFKVQIESPGKDQQDDFGPNGISQDQVQHFCPEQPNSLLIFDVEMNQPNNLGKVCWVEFGRMVRSFVDLLNHGPENLENPIVEVGFGRVANKNLNEELKKSFWWRHRVDQVARVDIRQIIRSQRFNNDAFNSVDKLWRVRQKCFRQGHDPLLFAFDTEPETLGWRVADVVFRRSSQKSGDVGSLQDVVKWKLVAEENSQRRLSWKRIQSMLLWVVWCL